MTYDEEIRKAEAHDHARAGERGERVKHIAADIVSALLAQGLLHDTGTAKVLTFHVLCEHLYPRVAIDIPTEL